MYYLQQAVALRKSYQGITISEMMADAYEIQAQKLIGSNQVILQQLKYTANQNIGEIRKTLQQLDPRYIETPEYQLIYGIKYKKQFIKIKANYWDTMKLLMESTTTQLSTQQLEYVNQQIEKQISYSYFKSIMGLTKI
jgi:hypothetical protein